MDIQAQQVISFIIQPAGNLYYHLWLIFALGICLLAQLRYIQKSQSSLQIHTTIAISFLLGLQILYFGADELNLSYNLELGGILALFDRAIASISVILIAWVWAYPNFSRELVRWVILVAILPVILLVITAGVLQPVTGQIPFSTSPVEWLWQLFSLLIICAGGAVLWWKHPANPEFGWLFLGLVFFGHLVQIGFPSLGGEIPGPVHLSELFAYPLLLALPFRNLGERRAGKSSITSPRPPLQERRRYSADPKTVHAFLNLALENDPGRACTTITRAISQALLADICILLSNLPGNQLVMEGGYDLIREEGLGGHAIDKETIPLISNSIEQKRSLRIPANLSNAIDIKTFAQLLGLNDPGNILIVPLVASGEAVLGGIILFSPYSNRIWSGDDQVYLEKITADIMPLYLRFQNLNQHDPAGDALRSELEKASQEVVELQKAVSNLRIENERLLDLQQGQTSKIETSHLENELRLALSEVARLQNSLAQANMRILQMEKESPPKN